MTLRFRLILAASLILVVAMGVLAAWLIQREREEMFFRARDEARLLARVFLATRSFVAETGATVGQAREGTGPEFRHLVPAAVGRGIAEAVEGLTGYRIKQTSLRVRNPANAPDAYEKRVLERFSAGGVSEHWETTRLGTKPVFRYLLPLRMEGPCLPCHGPPAGEPDPTGHPREGYELGQVAGALSITIPMEFYYQRIRSRIWALALVTVFAVLFLILFFSAMIQAFVADPLDDLMREAARMGRGDFSSLPESLKLGFFHPPEIRYLYGEFRLMALRLGEMYRQLEEKVTERTEDLHRAVRDLEEKKKELERLNEKLLEADRLKSHFLAVMSHELRTPLSAIIAAAEILLRAGVAEDNEEHRSFLEDILESGQRLLDLIDELLDLARIEAGEMKLDCEVVLIQDLAASVVRSVEPLAREKGVALELRTSPLPPVWVDPGKMRQVLLNLLGNAIKFTPSGGRVILSVSGGDGRGVVVSVEDTGIGIPPELQKVIFDKFRQGHMTVAREYGGAGLGLSLARHLVEMHGGQIWVRSQPGRGSRFSFSIPPERVKMYSE